MRKELFLHVRDVNDFEHAVSNVFPIEIREYDGHKFFVPVDAIPKEVRLPNDFFLREFMELDASDLDALLEFQNRWGYIESFHHGLSELAHVSEDAFNVIFGDTGIKSEYEAARISAMTRVLAEQVKIDASGDDWEIDRETWERSSAVYVEEAQICVENAQLFIKALVDASQYGIIEEFKSKNYMLATLAVKQVQQAVDMYFPPLEILDARELHYRTSRVPLIPLVYAQCLNGIQENQRGAYVFRDCAYCGKKFQLGRKGDGAQAFTARRTDSRFCCAEHQRLYNKHSRGKDGKWKY